VNILKHTVDISQDVIIPVAQHAIIVRCENFGALRVRGQLRCVLASIHLHNQALRMTREVNDVPINSNLTTKMRPRHAEAMTQMPP
jgi:hypothetical protein